MTTSTVISFIYEIHFDWLNKIFRRLFSKRHRVLRHRVFLSLVRSVEFEAGRISVLKIKRDHSAYIGKMAAVNKLLIISVCHLVAARNVNKHRISRQLF